MGIPVIWKDVVGYENLYSISNMGIVYSKITNRERKQVLNKANGYFMLFLVDLKGGKKCVYVHRLVAMAFIDREEGKDVVNHLDENKTNNKAENLEWCTKKYNNLYNDKIAVSRKPVRQMTTEGEEIKIWESAREASRHLGLEYKNISACCLGKRNICGGFGWEFASKGEVA